MFKKLFLLLVIITTIPIIMFFVKGGDIDDLIRLSKTETTSFKRSVLEYGDNKERGRLVVQHGGQEKVDELYQQSPEFCLIDNDCVIQEDSCCGGVVNKHHYKAFTPERGQAYCEMVCMDIDKVLCEDNECKISYKKTTK